MVRNSNSGSVSEGVERQRRRAEARRREILAAAARVFRDKGYAAAGMREIAAEADLSPGNLYHYFAGKDEILFFCQDRFLDELLTALQAARLTQAPVREQLRGVLQAHVRCLLDAFAGATAHLEVEALPEERRAPVIAKRDRYERGIRKLVAEGVRRNEFFPCEPKIVTRAMLGAMNWSARWYRPDGARSVTALADSLSDYLIRGLSGAAETNKRGAEKAGRGGIP